MAKYRIAADGQSITCLTCRTRSYNKNDIRWRYCGFCHVYHEDAPPSRLAQLIGRLRDRLRLRRATPAG